MELVIEKQAMTSVSECAPYVVPDGMWARFRFEGCYPDGKGTIAKGGEVKAQLSMHNDTVLIRESGSFQVCVIGRNTKSSIYVELLCDDTVSEKVIVAAGKNVTVDTEEQDTTTIYTVNARGVVIQAGEYITVSKTAGTDTDTWTISGEQGGSNTVVKAGTNITVNESKSGNVTTYTVNGTEQGSHTVVKAGNNVTVTEGTEGNKTTYTVNATVPAPAEQKTYKVTSTDTSTLTVAENTSGNTTTFSLTATGGGGGGGGDVELESTDPNLIITKE